MYTRHKHIVQNQENLPGMVKTEKIVTKRK